MWSNSADYDSDQCPVDESLLGALYRASDNGLPELMESVPPAVRAMLALFCYRRSHLHGLGIAIAASCSRDDLLQQGGRAGATLYDLAHEARPSAKRAPATSHHRKVTLSTAPLRTMPAFDDDFDEPDDLDEAEPSASA
ncbi:MAG TPA: hypothetical protein VNZ94_09770 [Xanthobacteraceae bacterium]|nr:hypothetical protein [Xanthobacteraceae bacterium]